MSSIFTKIVQGDIPSYKVAEDENYYAFLDIYPLKKGHVLVIPKKPIVGVSSAADEDEAVLGHLLLVAKRVAEIEGIAESGYRLVVNNGTHGGQTVYHLHVHVLGGRDFRWPPG